MRSIGSRLRWVLRVIVSGSIVGYILYDIDWQDLAAAIAGVRLPLLMLAALLYLAGQILSAFKWSVLGRAVGFERPLRDYVRFYFVGMFFNLFGPSTLGGDLARSLYLSDGHRRGVALNSTIFDRLSGLAVLMALGAAAMLLGPQYDFPPVLQLTVVLAGCGVTAAWWVSPRVGALLPQGSAVRRLIEHDLTAFWTDHRLLVRVGALSLVFHLSQVVVQLVLARAVGVDLPFSYLLVVHPMLSVMMALPLSVGGFGVREGGYLYFLTRVDVDGSIAVTMALLWWSVTVVSALVGGLAFLTTGGRLPRFASRRTREPSEPATNPAESELPPL